MSGFTCSEGQLAANRANARKSTGPRTPQGKARSSQNAVKHQLFRTVLVLNDESQEEFDDLMLEVMNSYEPQNAGERLLLEQIVEANWKLRRFQRAERELYEAAAFDDLDNHFSIDDEVIEYSAAGVTTQLLADKSRALEFERLMKAQQRLQGTIARAQRELERMRRLRRQARKDEAEDLHISTVFPLQPLKPEDDPEYVPEEDQALQNEPNSAATQATADGCVTDPAPRPTEPARQAPLDRSALSDLCDPPAPVDPDPRL